MTQRGMSLATGHWPGEPGGGALIVADIPRSSGRTRRVIDTVIVILVAPIVVPLCSVIALAIALTSPGPVFWTQVRYGHQGEPFQIYKFRTMVRDADRLKEQLRHLSVLPWPDFKIHNDPRITPVGRWLRKTSLDELPQLWNLLKGDMTLVGPRPSHIDLRHYRLWQIERLDGTPGLFGRWQAEGRGSVDFDSRCRMDISQVLAASFWADGRLALKTLVALTTRGGV